MWKSILSASLIFLCFKPFDSSSKFEVSKSLFSPKGEILQVEYALQAVDHSTVVNLGIKCTDGLLLLAVPLPDSASISYGEEGLDGVNNIRQYLRRAENRSYIHIVVVDSICTCIAGIPSDCTHTVQILRQYAENYRNTYGSLIPGKKLADFIASYLHDQTMDSSTRPLAVSVILGCMSGDGPSKTPHLYSIDCTGVISETAFCTSLNPHRKGKFGGQTKYHEDDLRSSLVSIYDEILKECDDGMTDETTESPARHSSRRHRSTSLKASDLWRRFRSRILGITAKFPGCPPLQAVLLTSGGLTRLDPLIDYNEEKEVNSPVSSTL